MASYEELFRQALRIRLVEERIMELYPSDKIQSPVHLSVGQEHHVAALVANLRPDDPVFSSYRCHAVYLAKGGSLKKMFAELYGKRTGGAGGKAGSMHLCAPEVSMYGSSAIVAATVSHAMGMAFANKSLKTGRVAVTFNGDGAMEEGVFHECLNFSSLQSLPVLFVVENNGLAIHSRLAERQAFRSEALVRAYGAAYHAVPNGYDLQAVHAGSAEVIAAVRREGRPAVLEVGTYRMVQHVGPGRELDLPYRDPAEVRLWQERDPLLRAPDLVARLRPAILAEIDEAVRFAEASPFPEPEDLLKDVH